MSAQDLSILFVEDDKELRHEITEFLNSGIFKNVYVAKNGSKGFLKYQKYRPDIIMTDLTMPLMDGLEMSKKIRQLDTKIPILLITSHFEKEITEAAVDIGIDAYLFKPLSLERVVKILTKYKELILLQREVDRKRKVQEKLLQRRIEEELKKNKKLRKEKEQERLLKEKFLIIGKMAAGITHEINTPLTYIKGNIELMQDDIQSLDDTINIKKYLQKESETILEGINRIACIIESMREMASQAKELPIRSNIYASLIMALTLSANKTASITLQNEPFIIGMEKQKHSFLADIQKQRIEQVFIIIINNALDALKTNGSSEQKLLNITLHETTNHIVVSFHDNGGGIQEALLPLIFEPFQSSKSEGGIGIGLNVAHKIVEEHGGSIRACNRDDGALFEVSLLKELKILSDV
jgi:C4-dicarboxylate-specific signal transduction histidine kinase